jgi:hypothetical protein
MPDDSETIALHVTVICGAILSSIIIVRMHPKEGVMSLIMWTDGAYWPFLHDRHFIGVCAPQPLGRPINTAIGGSFRSPTFQGKYFTARTSAPKCFLKQNLLAELKPPSDLVLTLMFDVLDMGSRHLVQGHPDLSGRPFLRRLRRPHLSSSGCTQT